MRLMKSILTDGKLDGCGITFSGANITVAAGRIVAGGALVTVESTIVTVTGAGELVLKIDTNAGTASILARTAAPLTQQDIAGMGTIYEIQLATFGFTSGSVSGLTIKIGTAKPVGGSSFSVTYGTASPSGGSDGDIYFKIES